MIATRHRPALLRRAVASVLDQRYGGDVEVLAVFDQSPAEPDLAQEAPGADGRGARDVRVLANERSPGLAGARNTGITAARGELVAFCDDDDLWLPGKLAAQAERLDAEPGLELVTTGVLVEARSKVSTRVLDRDRITHDELLRSRVSEAHPSTFLFRRAALVSPDGIGLVDESLPGSYAEDYDILLRAARRHPVGVVTLPLAKVFWHRSSFFAERWQTIVDALDHLVASHPELADEPRGLARIEGQQAFARASMHDRRGAWRTARRALAHNRREPRAWLALAVASGAVRSEWVLRALQAGGRGI